MATFYLLQEDANYILQENGFKLIVYTASDYTDVNMQPRATINIGLPSKRFTRKTSVIKRTKQDTPSASKVRH